jgi:hypothetical protein
MIAPMCRSVDKAAISARESNRLLHDAGALAALYYLSNNTFCTFVACG